VAKETKAKAMTETTVRRALAIRLRTLHQAKAMTQARLGRASDLSVKFIGEVERAQKSISVDSLCRISRALDVPLEAMMKFDAQRPTERVVAEQLEQLLALVRRHPTQLRRVLAVVDQLVR